jgi:VCBS repeat-containing protein
MVSIIKCDNVEIMNCRIGDSHKNALCFKEGCNNIRIHHNEIYGTGYVDTDTSSGTTTTGIYIDGQTDPSDNYKIYDNIIHGCNSGAIVVGCEVTPFPAQTNIEVYNNLIYDNYQGFVVWPNPFARNFRVINNTFYNNLQAISIYGSLATGNLGTNLDCVIRNNIIYGYYYDDYMIYYNSKAGIISIDHNLLYNSSGVYPPYVATIARDSTFGDPLFVDQPADFHLQARSLAINSGSLDNAPTSDYVGTARPFGAGIDIGAYEYAVTSHNQAPVLNFIGNRTVNEGALLSFTISATDPDGDTLTYSASNLPSGATFTPSTRAFSWIPTSGQAGTYANVHFQVTDGILNDYEDITITVSDVAKNQAPTNISLSNTSVAENQAVNTVVGAFSSTDPDSGSTFTYTLVTGTGSTDNASFTISGNTLKTGAVFNYETKSSYSIRVRTTDNGSLYYEKAFTITITNANETPTGLTLSNSSVAENQPSGTTVGTFSTTDADAGDTFTYTLVSGTGSTDNASFTISGNTLKTGAVFNYETKSSYSVRVRTTDSGSLYYEKTLSISVTAPNTPPVANNDTNTTLKNTTLNVTAPGVLANDTDADSEHLTAIKITGPVNGTLTLDASGSYTYTPNTGYVGTDTFTYQANDGTTDSNIATVSILVTEPPSPPPSPPPSGGGASGGGGGGGGGSEDLTIPVTLTGLTSEPAITLNLKGQVRDNVQLSTDDGNCILEIPSATYLTDRYGEILTEITVAKSETPPAPPVDDMVVMAYDFGPTGASFYPYMTLILKYDPEMLSGVDPADLKMAHWNGINWEILQDTVLDTEIHTISVRIWHVSSYAFLSPVIATATTIPVPITTTPSPTTTTPTIIPTPPPAPEEAPTSITPLAPEITIPTPAPVEVTTTIAPVTTTEATTDEVSVYRLSLLASAIGVAVFFIAMVTAIILMVHRRRPNSSQSL